MATQAASCSSFDLLYANDGHFPFFSHQNESKDYEVLLQFLSDTEFAEELQFQEVLKASSITCHQTPTYVPSSQQVTMEKGESSLIACEMCLERKEKDQMNKNGDPTLCLDCSEIVELSKKRWFCGELDMKITCGNGSGTLFTANTRKNQSQMAETDQFDQGEGDIVSLNSVQNDHKLKVSDSKDDNRVENRAENLQGSQHPNYPGLQGDANSKIPVGGENGEPQSSNSSHKKSSSDVENNVAVADDNSDSDALNDTDEFDSDTSQKGLQNCKERKLFKEFFDRLEKLTTEEINEPAKQWHCPACQGGPGANRWYRGHRALIAHAKTKAGTKLKLHRELAQLLEGKFCSKRTSAIPAGEAFGKWKGLDDEQKDYEIVWPPMVVIRNTSLRKDETNKWIGMTDQDLIDFFNSYDGIERAQQAYNSFQGHCGMSILIFESTAQGYLQAECLHKHFAAQGIGRDAWHHDPVCLLSSGKRQLYGYMAVKEDLDMFKQYSGGKPNLKYEMRSYQEMVVNQIRHISEENRQLIWLKNHGAQQQRTEKVVEENTRERLDQAMKELNVLRHKMNLLLEQNKEEMDFQEQFFNDQMKVILEARNEKGGDFENAEQKEEGNEDRSNPQDYKYGYNN